MHVSRYSLILLALAFLPALAWGQGYAFQVFDPEVSPGLPLQFRAYLNDGTALLRNNRDGGLTYRATLFPLTLTPVECPGETFVRFCRSTVV